MVLVKWILGIIAVISLIITIKSLRALIVSKESFWKKFKSVLFAPFNFIFTFFGVACVLFLPMYIILALLLTTVEFIGNDNEETAEKKLDSDLPAICQEDPKDFSDEAIEALYGTSLEYLDEENSEGDEEVYNPVDEDRRQNLILEGSSVSAYEKYQADVEKTREMYNKQREYDMYCVNHPRNEYPNGYDSDPVYKDDSETNDPYIYWVDEYYREDGTHVDGHIKTSADGDESNNLSGQ